ncbi:hypothetical protein [Streptomyces fuscigenes]|uniref:hypothetical protein n=1 Tax=Streptomyces fuscigenes TaxID=1528880 RepID=UPI001F436DFA|nr:hypothetical protein [Streptomyces fuscigenes]MCF3965054.1 hypothetical protein [Streptomyces fuscigenes]
MPITTRTRIALISTFPTLLAAAGIGVLVVFGALPWGVLPALPVPVALHAAVAFVRLGSPRSSA